MLVCAACGKVIANVDPSKVRYGGCASCNMEDIKRGIKSMEKANEK